MESREMVTRIFTISSRVNTRKFLMNPAALPHLQKNGQAAPPPRWLGSGGTKLRVGESCFDPVPGCAKLQRNLRPGR
jgi:hypothetical protein